MWKRDTTPITKRNDPRWIAILEKRERQARRKAAFKVFAHEAADATAAGVASIVLFAVMSLIIYGLGVA